MNTIYRIIWNRAKSEWTVASELAVPAGGSKGGARTCSHAVGVLRRLPWALACALGGLILGMPMAHAQDQNVPSEHQHLEKINSRLADLSDLLVKYGKADDKVAHRVAPNEVATGPRNMPQPGAGMRQHSSVRVSAPASRSGVQESTASVAAVVKPAAHHVRTVEHVRPSAKTSTASALHHAAPANALSPQLASDAQINAVLAHRQAAPRGQGRDPETHAPGEAATWVIDNQGSLHVETARSRPRAAIASVDHVHTRATPEISRTSATETAVAMHTSPLNVSRPLPSIPVSLAGVTVSLDDGFLASLDVPTPVQVATVGKVTATTNFSGAPNPVPHVPVPDSTTRQVAYVSSTSARSSVSAQTSGLTLDVDPRTSTLAMAGSGTGLSAERREAALTSHPVSNNPARKNAEPSDKQKGVPTTSSRLASASAPVLYEGNSDAAGSTRGMQQAAPMFGSANMTPMAFAPRAVMPMALPSGDPRRPPPPESPAPGLLIGTGGLLGQTGATLNPVTSALLNPSDPDYHAGALTLSKANVTTAYGGGVKISVAGIGLVTVPISVANTLNAVGGTTYGTASNQHLTLLGGVHSQNYITNINNGATNGGILNASDPAWSDSCLNVNIAGLLGVDVPCWGVNAAQNNQVLVGDGATANGSEEVVIGTGASHTLPSESANTVFPGDGDRNSSTDPMGVPNSDYQSRKGHSVVIGDSASGTQNEQTILGANATSDQANSVALGYGSNADRGMQAGYTNAYGLEGSAQNSAGEVAVGNAGHERQITHVAAGTGDHDAVNVLQLKGAVIKATKGAVLYDVDGSGNIVNNVTLVGDGSGAPVGMTNLKAGAVDSTSLDAVNGSQLYGTNTTIANYFGGTTNYDGTTNTWTPPDFKITNIDSSGNKTVGDYNNVTDAFNALNTSVVNIYDNGVKYFHAKSSGPDSNPTGADSIAVGPAATSAGKNAIAIGNGANAGNDDSVALGSGSATTVGAQSNYSAYGLTATQTSSGEVNVGNRQVTGVAAGSADSDAVNVAQLKSVASTADNSVQYDNPARTSVTLAGPVSTDGGATGGTSITNLHQGVLGANSTDAVNGSQLYATNTTIATYLGGTTHYDGTTNTWTAPDFKISNIDLQGNSTTGDYNNVTDAFDALNTSLLNVNKRITNNSNGLKYFKANSTAADASATGTESVAMGGDTQAVGDGSVAAGSGAKAQSDGSVAIGQKASADGGQAVAIGSGASASGDGAVSIGDPNVAAGAGAVALGKDNTANGDGAVALGNTSTAKGQGAVAMGNTASATADGSVAIGNNAASSVAGGIALGEGSVASRNGGGTEAFTKIAVPKVGAVSVGAPDHLRQITNVAGGSEDTDAVNVRQLKTVAGKISGVDKLAVKYDADKNGDPTNTVTLTGDGSGAPILITNVAAGAITKNSLDAINGSQLYDWTQSINNKYSNINLYKYIQNLSGGGNFAVNDTDNLGNPSASGDNSAAGGAGTVASGSNSTAVGNGAKASGDNSVALGAGSVADRDDTVSVGSKGHERQVTNVAAGTQDTDAVNVSQLNASTHGTVRYDVNKDGSTNYNSVTLGKPGGGGGETVIHNVGDGVADTDAVNVRQLDGIKDWARQYSNEQYSNLTRQLNNLGDHAYAGVASAMAMAGLPQAYLPGKSMASIAASSFHGESSIAVGVSLISDNGRWVYKFNGTDNSRGDAGVSMGVGIQW